LRGGTPSWTCERWRKPARSLSTIARRKRGRACANRVAAAPLKSFSLAAVALPAFSLPRAQTYAYLSNATSAKRVGKARAPAESFEVDHRSRRLDQAPLREGDSPAVPPHLCELKCDERRSGLWAGTFRRRRVKGESQSTKTEKRGPLRAGHASEQGLSWKRSIISVRTCPRCTPAFAVAMERQVLPSVLLWQLGSPDV
jgi:hypothetical protein